MDISKEKFVELFEKGHLWAAEGGNSFGQTPAGCHFSPIRYRAYTQDDLDRALRCRKQEFFKVSATGNVDCGHGYFHTKVAEHQPQDTPEQLCQENLTYQRTLA